MQAPAVDLAGRTSLGLLAALVARSALVVCNDTGVSHMAAAARTPSVVISPVSDPRRWGPLDRRLHRVVDARAGASVADVWESVEAILGGSEDDQRPHPAGLTMFASRSKAQRSERPITTK
jgi:ADP-heptose:LPS heptosyltransferase